MEVYTSFLEPSYRDSALLLSKTHQPFKLRLLHIASIPCTKYICQNKCRPLRFRGGICATTTESERCVRQLNNPIHCIRWDGKTNSRESSRRTGNHSVHTLGLSALLMRLITPLHKFRACNMNPTNSFEQCSELLSSSAVHQ